MLLPNFVDFGLVKLFPSVHARMSFPVLAVCDGAPTNLTKAHQRFKCGIKLRSVSVDMTPLPVVPAVVCSCSIMLEVNVDGRDAFLWGGCYADPEG